MPNYYKSDSGFVETIPGSLTVTDLAVTDDATVADDLAVTGDTTSGTYNGIQVVVGSVIPTDGAGVAATAPALYLRTGTNQLWYKSGAPDTSWTSASQDMIASNGFAYLSATAGAISTANGASMTFTGRVALTGVISPTAIGTNQTDYTPASIGAASVLRQDVSAACTINTLVATAAGHVLDLWNISNTAANTLTLLHDDGATGTAGNRILCPANTSLVIPRNGYARLWYDGGSSRWRASRGY